MLFCDGLVLIVYVRNCLIIAKLAYQLTRMLIIIIPRGVAARGIRYACMYVYSNRITASLAIAMRRKLAIQNCMCMLFCDELVLIV